MKLNDIKIREYNNNDYAGLVALHNLIEPDYAMTEKEFKHWDKNRNPKCFLYKIVAEHNSEIVGTAEFSHYSDMFHPDKYFGFVEVTHKYRNMGLGSKLFEILVKKLKERSAVVLRSEVRESQLEGVRFAKKNGFVAESEEWESRADPRIFDFEKYDTLFEKLKKEGIEIVNLAEELKEKPSFKQQLHKLSSLVSADVPSPVEYTPTEYEPWEKRLFAAPNILPEAFLIAKKDDKYIAFHSLWAAEAKPHDVTIGMTGVLRAWRNKGIAKALKVINTKWAKVNGYTRIITWNNSENVEILKINNEFGFVRQPTWIGYKKDLTWR